MTVLPNIKIHSNKILVILLILTLIATCSSVNITSAEVTEDLFGIYSATLDGKNLHLIISNQTQEMSHPRVSPNGEWITFTRYTQVGQNGTCEESNGYIETEIMLVKTDGTNLQTLIPPKKYAMNANSSWSPNGEYVIYITTETPNHMPMLAKINIDSKEIEFFKTPKNLIVTDPNQVNDWICFPGRVNNFCQQNIWMMKSDGSEVILVTNKNITARHKNLDFMLGDYDPHFSPDASKIGFMRYFGGFEWHIVIVDVKTGIETDLTEPLLGENSISATTSNPTENSIFADTVPTWSPCGDLILFRHIELPKIEKIGLYTMKPDGSERKKINLPKGYFFGTISSFFPNQENSNNQKIIFHARKDSRF